MLKKLDENYKFATFLKGNADEDILDRQFKELHKKYFKNYDCSKCMKCCKKLEACFSEEEVKKGAERLNYSAEKFKEIYLKSKVGENKYYTKRVPCPFLKSGECILGEDKPKDCTEYPYTNKTGRLFSLYSMVCNTEICPILNKIFEELKEIYQFKVR